MTTTITIAALFGFAATPPPERELDAQWMSQHSVAAFYAPTVDALPHGALFLDGLAERAILIDVGADTTEAMSAARTTHAAANLR